jgi:hypothetical protein
LPVRSKQILTGIKTPLNIPALSQSITYTPFLQPSQITEGTNVLNYTYGSDMQRIKMVSDLEKRYYFKNLEVNHYGSGIYKLYNIPLGGNVSAMVVQQGGINTIFYTYSDYLGSILGYKQYWGCDCRAKL